MSPNTVKAYQETMADLKIEAQRATNLVNDEKANQLSTSLKGIEEAGLLGQGKPVDIGGYYCPDEAICAAAMRPSVTLNAIIEGITGVRAAAPD